MLESIVFILIQTPYISPPKLYFAELFLKMHYFITIND